MNIMKMTQQMLTDIHEDLDRPHAFALERVGFLSCGAARMAEGGMFLYAQRYHPVDDADYEDADDAGAAINGAAFRKIFQLGLGAKVALFHIHRHEHRGRPRPSRIDVREYAKFVPDFFNVRPDMPHGALILSRDSAWGQILLGKANPPCLLDALEVVGAQVYRQ